MLLHIKAKISLLLLLILSTSTAILSFYIHMPRDQPLLDNMGLGYSDIVHTLFNPIFKDIVNPDGSLNSAKAEEQWFNIDKARELIAVGSACPIPYRDYRFDQPPLVGALWFFSTCIAFRISTQADYSQSMYIELSRKALEVHYYIHAGMLVAFFFIAMVYLYRIATMSGGSPLKIALFVLLPSTILYLIYSWEVIALAFIAMALYYMIAEEYLKAGLALGLAISASPISFILALVFLYDLFQKSIRNNVYREELVRIGLSSAFVSAIAYLSILILSSSGFSHLVNQYMQIGCVNCIYLYITGNVSNPYNFVYAISVITAVLLMLLTIDINYSDVQSILSIALASLITITVLSNRFLPQYILLLTPIAVLILRGLKKILYLFTADVANFGIMALFFKDLEARVWIYNNIGLNLELKWDPYSLNSPVQLLALVRNIIFVLILIDVVYTLIRLKGGIRASKLSTS